MIELSMDECLGKIANGQLKYTCCCAASVHVKYPNFKIIDSK